MGWLYLAIAVFTGFGICFNYLILKNDAEKKDEKVKQMAFVQLGIGLVLAFATYYATVLDGRQKDRLETLANLNNQLAGHIDTLSLLNDSIATKIKANIDTTQASVNKNVSLIDSINNLTTAIQQLVFPFTRRE
jgi:hypothetical protein